MKICEALGKDPDLDRMPLEDGDFPFEVQMAFFIHDILPERWDGASGSYLGKDWSALHTLLDVYEVEDRVTVILFLKYVDMYNMSISDLENKLVHE